MKFGLSSILLIAAVVLFVLAAISDNLGNYLDPMALGAAALASSFLAPASAGTKANPAASVACADEGAVGATANTHVELVHAASIRPSRRNR